MAVERILGTETGKSAFEKTDRNVVDLDARLVADISVLVAHKAEIVSQMVTASRDATLTGVQTISVLPGRKPKTIQSFGIVQNTKKQSAGLFAGNNACNYTFGDTGNYSTGSPSILIADTGVNRTFGTIQNVVDGSFDINWTHTGTGGTGTIQVQFLIQYHD